MRSKYIVWSLVLTMLVTNVFLNVGFPAKVSAAGGENLALGKQVTASSYNQTYSPAHVIDNNQSTYWESANNAFPQWIQVDLGANTTLEQINLKLPSAWETRSQTITIQGSSNGSTFTDIVASKDYIFDPSLAENTTTINFEAIETRYVRLKVTGNTEWPAAQLSEFEIYGPPSQEPNPDPTEPGAPVEGTNIAIGKAITASSSSQSYVAANANDNNINTYWEGGSNPSTLTLDLGSNHQITAIVLRLNPDPIWSTRTQTIQVLGHNQDTTTFSNFVSAQSYTFNPASGNNVKIPVAATVKRLQLNITANSGAPAGQIAEFQVFGTAAPNPDLTITGMSWTPSSPVENSPITLNATVKNMGSAASPASIVNFYLNNELAGSASVNALQAGASTTVSLNAGNRTAASYTLSAKVDEKNQIIEENESNNHYTHSSALIIAPITSSDLVGTVSWNPSNPTANSTVAFTVNLKNQGNQASAGGAHGVTVVLKNAAGAPIQTYSGSYNGVLAPGASVNVNVGSWTAANGNYNVTTTVAADSNEAQVKQSNNVSTTPHILPAERACRTQGMIRMMQLVEVVQR